MVTRFEVLLELKTKPDGQSVSFKHDGRRFASSTTVKLCVEQAYTLTLQFRPAYELKAWYVEGQSLNFVAVAKETKKEKDMAAYAAVWSSEGFKVTKNGKRYDLRLHLELENELVLKTSMQVKFYNRSQRTASQWGQPMHLLDLSCDALPGQKQVAVRRGSIL